MRTFFKYSCWLFFILCLIIGALIGFELQSSRLQAHYVKKYTEKIFYSVETGPSPSIVFPQKGPSDERRGYIMLPTFTEHLLAKGYTIESQSRFSATMFDLAQKGINPTYIEKTQAGLRLLDRSGELLYNSNYPMKIYPDFASIPSEVTQTLLFIENKSLLDSLHPYRNPALEWIRFVKAGTEFIRKRLGIGEDVPGGSTLATQLEKYKHSDEGRTVGATEKLQQMVSASLRAYQQGENTLDARRRIALEYINTVPLAALPGYGEVNGLGDGLLAWYGTPIDTLNRLLRQPVALRLSPEGIDSGVDMAKTGLAYRKVLNLFIAHRRPTSYLLQNRLALKSISQSYVGLVGQGYNITPQLRDAALLADPVLMKRAAPFPPTGFAERKAVNAIRAHLTTLLGLPRLYDLDRLDLHVQTTLDGQTQSSVVQLLKRLGTKAFVDSSGLNAFRLLDKGDPAKVIYSFTLYEHVPGRNLLRVQADNYEQPFNINEGVKLDLGSTAKLRTLVNYLEIVCSLHQRFKGKTREALDSIKIIGNDPITSWTLDYFKAGNDSTLDTLLAVALDRKYSASPAETFFTGGGAHTFVNFETDYDHQAITLRLGFRHSINLVFVRLMRDIVSYYRAQIPGAAGLIQDTIASPERQKYLGKFAEQEGQVFLSRFFKKYRGHVFAEMEDEFFQGVHTSPRRLTTAYLSIHPDANKNQFFAFIREQMSDSLYPQKVMEPLFDQFFKDSLSLADRGYVAGVHPLDLWLISYLKQYPSAGWNQIKDASKTEVQGVYRWLFQSHSKHAQDFRISSILEMEAFLEIHKAWQRLGYPFGSLVPSYATSIGSSADRPMALAELVGLIQNEGMHYPSTAMRKLHFGEGTPYETVFSSSDSSGIRLLPLALTQAIKGCLLDIVEKGTAVRGYKAFPLADGKYIPLGGKTGTGDQRFDTFAPGGKLLESRVVNRTATFVFFLGDRFFGTVTAHVHGEAAKDFGFTSSLPVQILKTLRPSLMPLLMANPGTVPALPAKTLAQVAVEAKQALENGDPLVKHAEVLDHVASKIFNRNKH